MKKDIYATLFLLLISGSCLYSQSSGTGTLEIEFTGIRSLEGQIAVGVNTSPEGWPREPEEELLWTKENMKGGTLVVTIENLEYGTYAFSVLDDLDFDQEMKFFMGIPREGFGFSRNPPHKLSEPDFEECSIEVNQPHQKITIEMRYIAKRDKTD
jgi:uncharacterized protein (DUF2141 family)